MSKYQGGARIKREQRPWEIHPIWRGIGCVMIVLIVVMAYAGAQIALQVNLIPMPPEMSGGITVPAVFVLPYVNTGIPMPWHGFIPYKLLFYFAVFAMLGFGAFTVLYAFLYRFVGPPRYSKIDAAPLRSPRRRRY